MNKNVKCDIQKRKIEKNCSVETLIFSTNCESFIIGGDRACPSEPPLRFAMGVVVPSLELSFQRGCHSGGGEGITSRSPEGALREIL